MVPLLVVVACASRSSPAVERLFGVLDRDGDGVLGPAEMSSQASPTLDWRAWDHDRSGGLDPSELAAILDGVNPIPTWRRPPTAAP